MDKTVQTPVRYDKCSGNLVDANNMRIGIVYRNEPIASRAVEQCEYIAHVLNEHEPLKARVDELTEENRKLREALKRSRGWKEGDDDLCQCNHPRDEHWSRRQSCASCPAGNCETFTIAHEALKEKHG
jgi:hypothetical protein